MGYFNMTPEAYGEYVKSRSPSSKLLPNMLKAFVIGGLICCAGQGLLELCKACGLTEDLSATVTSVTLIFIGALLTGPGWYGGLASIGGAGTLVPITGFANSVAAPALEFKTEGLITGTGAKMFVIAGPVIVYGVSASVVYGVAVWVFGLF